MRTSLYMDIHMCLQITLCFCGVATGYVINIFLINDVLLQPSAFSLWTESMDCNPLFNTHTGAHSSDSPSRLKIDVFVHMQLNGVVDGTEQRETEGSPAEDTV